MKSVIAFIRHEDDVGNVRNFIESAVFGTDCHYESADKFIKELKELYKKAPGRHEFRITNVVIG